LFPAIPVIAILWGIGINKISIKLNKHFKIVIILFIILLNISFIGIVAAKSQISKNSWGKYNSDFVWIQSNTPDNSLFYYNGQCLAINIDRRSRFLPIQIQDVQPGYIFFNPDFTIEPHVILDELTQLNIIEKTGCSIIYTNPDTKTKICQIK